MRSCTANIPKFDIPLDRELQKAKLSAIISTFAAHAKHSFWAYYPKILAILSLAKFSW